MEMDGSNIKSIIFAFCNDEDEIFTVMSSSSDDSGEEDAVAAIMYTAGGQNSKRVSVKSYISDVRNIFFQKR